MKEVEYVIVGQGLAGSVLALTLLERGHAVLVVDQPRPDGASRVAAGLYNPITGRHLSLTWGAAQLFPFLRQFYPRWEQRWHTRFLHEMPVYRPFGSMEEQNTLTGKSGDPLFGKFMRLGDRHAAYRAWVHAPYGGLETLQSGYLDVPHFLEATRAYLHERESYRQESFDYQEIKISDEGVTGPDWRAARLIFCEGAAVRNNPWFRALPIVPNKGEILRLRTHTELPNVIFNRHVFMVPVAPGEVRVGATFDHSDLTTVPTERARLELLEKLQGLYPAETTVLDQVAGLRPTSRDRRPQLGLHPTHPQLGIFNGLGTKGVSLAPWWAERFAEFLEGKADLDPQVNINRYFSFIGKTSSI
ncbi:NAD(P)/FAD-dependent oxidoreductase [Catalinimonas alkaloidigena]|uniref:NAD(P)/FAD-dependent oxidoreductase n=1 Tax=Catalinimonas alkaloidigena TaxID=1075417 RepID=UPI0015A2A364|nr:FAD-dependent oxidoreductase [Catalinimonas alkaloidigena]